MKIDLKELNTQELIVKKVTEAVRSQFEQQKSTMGPYFEEIQKMILLQSIDHHWKMHLYVIDKLKEGIGLRGYAQKDPLIEYKKEAFVAFEKLNFLIKSEAIEKIMRVQLVAQQSEEFLESLVQEEPDLEELDYSAPTLDAPLAIGGSAGATDPEPAKQKKKLQMNSGPSADKQMNREDRRRMEKTRGKK